MVTGRKKPLTGGSDPIAACLRNIEGVLGREISDYRSLSSTNKTATYKITCSDGSLYFLKAEYELQGNITAESKNLIELADTRTVRVPQMYGSLDKLDDGNIPAFLITEFLTIASASTEHEVLAGAQLAQLHRCTNSHAGLGRHNFIGRMPQRNSWGATWSKFFLENRLEPQRNWGIQRGWLKSLSSQRIDRAWLTIESLLKPLDTEPMSLLHGDLWSGNLLSTVSGPVFIDPAVYYGHREMDLAFTHLFGGFGMDFYRSYRDSWPLAEGYESRVPIHNLYHLMNHANIFGGAYINQATASILSYS